MKQIILASLAALALSACSTTTMPGVPTSPAVLADKTVLDEKAGIAADTAYYAANRFAALAIRTGVVKSPATIKRIGALDLEAKAAVQKVRDAYDAGNSTSYGAALDQADKLTKDLLALIN